MFQAAWRPVRDRELACSPAESTSGYASRIRAIPEFLPSWIVVTALAVAVVSLLLSLAAVVRRRRSRRGRGTDPTSIGSSSLGELDELADRVSALAARVDAAEDAGAKMIQRVGVVRFNPFPDTGGNQSFVMAMLDARGDGVVLSSLHSRGGTRVYLKQVTTGRAEIALSQEEIQAIGRALGR